MDEREERRLALIALHLGVAPGEPAGERPSDEELAALLEQRLDPVRRAQVLSHLVADAALYGRWYALREGLAWLNDADAPDSIAPEEPRTTGAVAGWLAGLWRGLAVRPAWGGALAVLVLAVIVAPSALRPAYVRDIDRFYEALPASPRSVASPGSGARAMPSLAAAGPLQAQLEQGVLAGMERLGGEFVLPGIDRGGLLPGSTADRLARVLPSRRAAYELGRLGVAAMANCLSSSPDADYRAALAQFVALREELATREGEGRLFAIALAPTVDAPDPEMAVCAAATRLVDWIARGNLSGYE